MDKDKDMLGEAVNIAATKREKAKSDWMKDAANITKFQKLHDAHMEYKAAIEEWLSNNILDPKNSIPCETGNKNNATRI